MRQKMFFWLAWIIVISLSLPLYSKGKGVVFSAVGDILLDRGIRRIMEKRGMEYPFKEVQNFLSQCDILLGNLEGPLSDQGEPAKKKFVFRGDPSVVKFLKEVGVNVFSLANNHIMDYGRDAVFDTINILNNAELFPLGAGMNQTEACQPVIIEKNGITISFFALLGFPFEPTELTSDVPGPCRLRLNKLISMIQEIRDQTDFVVVSLHWGIEYDPFPHSLQIQDARQLIDAGVDLVIGHHPHVIQGIEKYKGKYILYSLGNFLFDQHADDGKESFLFICSLSLIVFIPFPRDFSAILIFFTISLNSSGSSDIL